MQDKNNNILKGFKIDIKGAVGIIFDTAGNILLGKAKTDDERNGKWVFVGGTVDTGESPLNTAIRETYEESGVLTQPVSTEMIIHPTKPDVAFFLLRAIETEPEIHYNFEYTDMKWFNVMELPENILSLNKYLLRKILNL